VSWYQKKHSPTHTHEDEEGFTDNKVYCMEAHPLYSALSQQGLLDPITPLPLLVLTNTNNNTQYIPVILKLLDDENLVTFKLSNYIESDI